MADQFGASITLLHSYQVPVVIFGEFMPISMPAPEDWHATAEKSIERFAREMFPGRKVTTVVGANDPGAAIKKTVQRVCADLVMMPASGHGPVRRLLLGSVTAKMLHDVGCPVWTSHDVMKGPPYQSIIGAVSIGVIG
jgi:nucleotide-binding universal stress UspA family protein